jgi:hypothetical protein
LPEWLQRIIDDLSVKLVMMEVERNAPKRIQVIQPAIVVGAGENAAAENQPDEDQSKQ